MQEKGNFPCLSEDWLIANLPENWGYDCSISDDGKFGFIVGPKETLYTDDGFLFIPLDLLKERR